ncbi:hypothetical protein ACIQSO_21905 [Pseudomonas putida]|uniref:hypothetical protein n=1 Tax=Pseudomonas putida TaxID=303 RepID=UPI003839F3A8
MNGAATNDQRAAVLAQLNASIDSFFHAGGAVERLPAADFVPRRPHREPDAAEKNSPINKLKASRQQRIVEVRELAKRMTYAQAMERTGLSQSTLVRYAFDGHFKFQPDPKRGKGNLGKKFSDPAVDREKAEQIIAYRNLCMTRYQVVRLMSISDKQLKRLLREFEIDFPTTAEKRATATA